MYKRQTLRAVPASSRSARIWTQNPRTGRTPAKWKTESSAQAHRSIDADNPKPHQPRTQQAQSEHSIEHATHDRSNLGRRVRLEGDVKTDNSLSWMETSPQIPHRCGGQRHNQLTVSTTSPLTPAPSRSARIWTQNTRTGRTPAKLKTEPSAQAHCSIDADD